MSVTLPPSSSVNSVQDLAQSLMKAFDKDQNGSLSTSEFAGLLGKLISGISDPASVSRSVSAPSTAPTNYTLGIGFVPSKLNDPTYYSAKYCHALKDQFLPAMQGLPPTTESVQTVVDRINANGGHAAMTAKDCIDFGDGKGPIDVIVDVGGANAQWGFQNS
jgi:hypothetical protein